MSQSHGRSLLTVRGGPLANFDNRKIHKARLRPQHMRWQNADGVVVRDAMIIRRKAVSQNGLPNAIIDQHCCHVCNTLATASQKL